MSWQVTSSPDGAAYQPGPPVGDVVALVGTLCKIDRPEYPITYADLRRRGRKKGPLRLVVQRGFHSIFGLRVWLQDPKFTRIWWWQTTHVRNTLLEDREFVAALVDAGMVELREGEPA